MNAKQKQEVNLADLLSAVDRMREALTVATKEQQEKEHDPRVLLNVDSTGKVKLDIAYKDLPPGHYKATIQEAPKKEFIPASFLKSGEIFKRQNAASKFMRLKPTSYLLNSSLVTDALNERKVFICNLDTGSLFIIKGDELVKIVEQP